MQIDKVEEPLIATRISQYPIDNLSEFLLLGRSNVGKSSFINTLIERKNFARTSAKPGKTQTLNFYLVNSIKHVFLLVDYRHKPTEDDILMYNFLKYYSLNITVVATKYDKVSKNGRIKQDKIIKDTLGLENDFIPWSTITKKGRDEVLEIIESYLEK